MGKDWEIIDLDLDPPKDGEVLVRFAAAGAVLLRRRPLTPVVGSG